MLLKFQIGMVIHSHPILLLNRGEYLVVRSCCVAQCKIPLTAPSILSGVRFELPPLTGDDVHWLCPQHFIKQQTEPFPST